MPTTLLPTTQTVAVVDQTLPVPSGVAIDPGALLATNPPDVQPAVAISNFDGSINYQQDIVVVAYNPYGSPVPFAPVDGTQVVLANGLCWPISTEDAIAYTISPPNGCPPYNAGVNPTDLTNTPQGPVDTTSMGTQAVDPSVQWNNPQLHGISDAVQGLVSPIIIASRNTSAMLRTAQATAATQQLTSPPTTMQAPAQPAAMQVSRKPPDYSAFFTGSPGDPGTHTVSPSMLALAVAAVGLILLGAA
jgi:hypothetical protein